jgi:hypothetical protein
MSVSRSIEQPTKRTSIYLGWVIVSVAFSLRSPLRQMKGQTFTSTVLAFCFVHPAHALLHSTPQLARGRRTVAQGLFRGAKFLVSGF